MKAIAAGTLGVTLALTLAGAAPAAEPDAAGERVLQSFAQCRTIADQAQRLACFDKAAGALEQAVRAKDVRIVDRGDVNKVRRSLFGFTLPRLNLFGNDEEDGKEQIFTEINSTIAAVRPVANNRVEIRLADETGAVWQTTDPMNFPPKPGAKIRIRRGTLGNFFMMIDGKSVRGMRLR
jgi:hypothetical protein